MKQKTKNLMYPITILLVLIATLINNFYASTLNYTNILITSTEVIAVMTISIFLVSLFKIKSSNMKVLYISIIYGLIGGLFQAISYGGNISMFIIAFGFRYVVSFASLYISKFVLEKI